MIKARSNRAGRARRHRLAKLSAIAFSTSIVASTVGLIVDNPIASASGPSITSVTITGNSTYPDPTIIVQGSGFGSLSSLGSPSAPGCSASGNDYPSNNLTFQNTTGIVHWIAGPPGACIGIFVLAYTNTEIAFSFGSDYNGYNDLNNGTGYSLTVLGTTVTGTVTYTQPPGWSAPLNYTSNDVEAVSCASSTFCAGVDDQGDVGVDNGSSINEGSIDPGQQLLAISCPSAAFCMTSDGNGSEFTYNGSWSSAVPFDAGNGAVGALSCTSSSFCAAGDSSGNAWTYNGSSWTEAANQDNGFDITSMSCASPTFCMAVDGDGNAFDWTGSAWGAPSAIAGAAGLTSVSCPTTTFCAAVDQSGQIATFDGSSWTAVVQIDFGIGQLESVSCPTASTCFATDILGRVYTYQVGSGTIAAGNIDPGDIVRSISCPATSFCVAVTNTGDAVTYTAPPSADVTDVSFSGSASSPTITVTGTGFGGESDLGAAQSPGSCGGTGSDYGSNFVLSDHTGNWTAGQGPNGCVGVLISSYSDTQIVFSLGSYYSNVSLNEGDSYTMTVLGSSFTGTVSYPTQISYSCNVPGVGAQTVTSGIDSFPTPPSSLAVSGTFQTTPQIQSEVPAAAVNQDIGFGVSQITLTAVSFDYLADDASGNPSTVVSPADSDIGATNLPQTFNLVPNTPIDFDLTFNPVTLTAAATGTAYFFPGDVNATYTTNLGSAGVTCTPSPFTTSGTPSTTVVPAPAGPAPQAPAVIPPVQTTVTSGGDSGWTVTVTNTGTTAAAGVSVSLTSSDGQLVPPNFDIAGMSRTEKGCVSAGVGAATCTVGTLASGASVNLSVLVSTLGLSTGAVVSVTAHVSSTGSAPSTRAASETGAGSHGSFSTSGLAPVTVVAPKQGTVITVAAPGVKVTNTAAPLTPNNPVRVTFELPKKVHQATLSHLATGVTSHKAVGNPLVGGPAVGATGDWLSSTQDPALCHAAAATLTGGTTCTPAEVKGNFCAYKDKTKPISATISIILNTVKGGTTSVPLYMEKDAETVVNGVCEPQGSTTPPILGPLPACGKAGKTGYVTPCVAKVTLSPKPKTTASNVTVTWTVYFVGTDPRMI